MRSPRCFLSLLCLSLLLPLAVLPLFGCAHSALAPMKAAAPPVGSVGAAAVQDSAGYHEAVRAYARHDYRGALRLLDALGRQPGLAQDVAAQDFLAYQRLLCRHALDPRVVVRRPTPVSSDVPRTARQADCGPRALLRVCRAEGVTADLADLRRQAGTTARGTTLAGLAAAARAHGFAAIGVRMDPQALSQLSRPAIVWVDGDHYVAVLSVEGGQATIHDPNQPGEEVMPVGQLWSRCGGVLLTLAHSCT